MLAISHVDAVIEGSDFQPPLSGRSAWERALRTSEDQTAFDDRRFHRRFTQSEWISYAPTVPNQENEELDGSPPVG
jgi:hypothetical protein